MLNILRRQHRGVLGIKLGAPPVTATAFVIGSRSAREQISMGFDSKDWMTDHWWAAAQRSGYLDIGCHSWDHVHPCVAEVMAETPHIARAFHRIATVEEADRQIAQPSRALRAITKNDAARLFAYPFGQTSDFLMREYLPRQNEVIGAFTITPEPVTSATSVWAIPRYVCGDAWTSPDDLRKLLH
jgi:peptidoglycan/xylan/chitin deacetylase (PgdA/CDA1 family)